ncbi:1-acyl-sn-glycerol-3-phosphate acyltransferase [bacterium]|nr:1-acyl-sn-glycerol-3-phosphate acyltransferase [bacterium]
MVHDISNLARIVGNFKLTLSLVIIGVVVAAINRFIFFEQTGFLFFASGITLIVLIIVTILYYSFGRWDTVLLTLLPVLPLLVFSDTNGLNHQALNYPHTFLYIGIILDLVTFITRLNTMFPTIKWLKASKPLLLLYFVLLMALLVALIWIKASNIYNYNPLVYYLSSASIVITGSLLLIPTVLHYAFHNRLEQRRYPLTVKLVLRSSFAYGVFLSGCLALVIVGFILFGFPFFRGKMQKRKLLYHRFISRFCRFIVYIMAEYHRFENEPGEEFTRPAVIIANHQSFIDLLIVIGLHPKVIILTNDWVWNSPFFGRIIQWVDYYPVSAGIENSFSLLREKVKEGYSIVVFPEGTRSRTMEINRFKKGAFFLAENLQLEILPVILHGTGDGIAKGDLILKKPKLTTRILPRIAIDDPTYGEGYSQRTKKISAYFKLQYKNLRQTYETPYYFKEHLKYTYTYQGFQAERAVKDTFKSLSSLEQLFDQVTNCKRLLHIGCEWGVVSHLLRFKFKSIEIMATDLDDNKINTAQTTQFIHDNIEFKSIDQFSEFTEKVDVCLINAESIDLENGSFVSLLDSINKQSGSKTKLIIDKQKFRFNPFQRFFFGDTKQEKRTNIHWEHKLNHILTPAGMPGTEKLTNIPNLVIIK